MILSMDTHVNDDLAVDTISCRTDCKMEEKVRQKYDWSIYSSRVNI